MGLIAGQAEAAGMSTLSMTSALSITRAVNPPRAAFVDFPLGHTSGRPLRPELNRAIIRDALAAFAELQQPGSVKLLDHHWDDDGWKDGAMRSRTSSGGVRDDRTERTPTPVYQTDDDRLLAEARHRRPGLCCTCIGADPIA